MAITPNTTYYLVFSGNSTLAIEGDTNNPYPNGQVYANPGYGSFPTFDYTFRTFSTAPSLCPLDQNQPINTAYMAHFGQTDLAQSFQTPMSGVCGVGSCSNTIGSYTCSCPAGYTFSGGTCTVNNPCIAGTDNCSSNATCMATSSTTFTCTCNRGYSGNGVTCTDVNECAVTPQPCGAGRCTNVPGTYSCACNTGYRAPATGGT